MTGWNYDIATDKRMTPEERDANTAMGGLLLAGGLGYLWLTRTSSDTVVEKNLKLYSAGASQETGLTSVSGQIELSGKTAEDNRLMGFNPNNEINIWAVHNGEDSMNATVKATFDDGSTKSITKQESKRVSQGENKVISDFDISPRTDFEKETTQDGKSISNYTVTLNVSGKGVRLARAYIVGA